jgi:hypothetical protein
VREVGFQVLDFVLFLKRSSLIGGFLVCQDLRVLSSYTFFSPLLCALFFLDDWQVFIKFLHLCWKKTWNQPQTGALGHPKPRPSRRPLGITWKEIQGFLKSLQPIWCQFQSCSFRQFLWRICFLEILSLDFVEDKQMPIPTIIFTLPLLASGRALKATLDEGPRSRDQWIQAILLIESIKLVPRPFRWGS